MPAPRALDYEWMADRFTKAMRSWTMSRIHGTNTRPELEVRRLLFAMGFRYRLHDARLPGRPDIVFAVRKKVIFVHGCFWHRHRCSKGRSLPSSRVRFWERKFAANVARDKLARRLLLEMGWKLLVVWACQIKNVAVTQRRCVEFLDG